MSVINDFLFPIFEHDASWCWVIEKKDTIQYIHKKYLDNKKWEDIIIIDSNFIKYKIKEINVIKKSGFFGIKWGLSGKYYDINPIYEKISSLTLEEIKNYIIIFLTQHPKIRESNNDLNRVVVEIKESQNFLKILAALQ